MRDRDWSAYVGCTASPLSGPLSQTELTAQLTALQTSIATTAAAITVASTNFATATTVYSVIQKFGLALGLVASGRSGQRVAPLTCAEMKAKWSTMLDLAAIVMDSELPDPTDEAATVLLALVEDMKDVIPSELCSTTELETIKTETEVQFSLAQTNIATITETFEVNPATMDIADPDLVASAALICTYLLSTPVCSHITLSLHDLYMILGILSIL